MYLETVAKSGWIPATLAHARIRSGCCFRKRISKSRSQTLFEPLPPYGPLATTGMVFGPDTSAAGVNAWGPGSSGFWNLISCLPAFPEWPEPQPAASRGTPLKNASNAKKLSDMRIAPTSRERCPTPMRRRRSETTRVVEERTRRIVEIRAKGGREASVDVVARPVREDRPDVIGAVP